MKILVVNADDFGRSAAINAGIIEGHQKGIVTSASLMTRREGFEEAVALAKANPKLGVGLHLDLDHFFNVQHGSGRLLSYQDPAMPMAAIVRETAEQIEKVLATGLPIGHLDGHHHVHLRPELFAAIAALTAKFKIPVIRYFKGFYEGLYPGVDMHWIPELVSRFGLRCAETFFAGWEPVESSLPGYRYFNSSQTTYSSEPFETAELMVHPGLEEPWRMRELMHCKSPMIRPKLEAAQIRLATFKDLANLVP